MRRPSALLLLALILASPAATAASVGHLYSATVPAAGGSGASQESAFREAMRDVLVRATGRQDAGELESLAPLVEQAARYVVTWRRVAGNQVAVSFDGAAIENAIDSAGLPFWGSERPATLVWLAVDRGGHLTLVTAATAGEEKEAVERAAARRGLPVVWPSAGDAVARSLQQLWSGDHAPLLAAARRYGADGVLIGRATAARDGLQAEWTFSGGGASAAAAGDLGAGPNLAADRYAQLYSAPTAGLRGEERITLTGIDTLEAYAAATQALGRLPVVRRVAVEEVGPSSVSFLLTVRGDHTALRQAIERDGRLVPVDAGRMVYALPR